ncbi:MAG: SDR family oxidoreductase [Acidimicrobiales bacterium]|nr:SDR family oxidoreductase [Acidimicrobiales bacterium]
MDRERLETLFDLTGRVAIVTGGTRGIGRAVAEGFVAAGAKVVVASRKADACDETAEHLRAMGGEAIGVPTHMGSLEDLGTLVDRTVDEFGGIDIVFNNAANALALPHGQLTPEAWQKSFEVNVRGPVFLVEAALPHLRASGRASIINMISVGAFTFSATMSLYAQGKAALLAATRAMAAEMIGDGIRVNAIAPGAIDTDMVRNNHEAVQDVMKNLAMMRRFGTADEIVGPALLLASDAGSFITGQVIVVDGGSHPY